MDLDIVRVQLKKEGTIYDVLPKIETSEIAAAVFSDFLADMDREVMAMLTLNRHHRPINLSVVSIGDLASTIVNPREMFKVAILSNAAWIVIAHNHPSGEVEPSDKDVAVTGRIKEVGELVGITLIDHVVIGRGEKYYSFRENGIMFSNKRKKAMDDKELVDTTGEKQQIEERWKNVLVKKQKANGCEKR